MDLLHIFSSIEKNNYKLVIIGEGTERHKLENTIEQLNLKDKVVLLGQVKDVESWIQKAKIFAFTSFYEGYPNALAEAMVGGLSCLSYDCPMGPSDIIEDNINGYLIPLGDKELYIQKLNKMIKDEVIISSFSKNGVRLSEDVNIQKIANKYLDFCMNYNK